MQPQFREYLREGERAGLRYRLTVPRDAPLGALGTETGHRAGASLDFKDYREYQPGDDLRHIDWQIYGRTDRLTVKLFREEVFPHVDLVLDGSCSMVLEDTAKARATLGLAALLAAAAGNAHCTHRAWLAGAGLLPLPGSGSSPAAWDGLAFAHAGSPAAALRTPPAWRPRGVRVLISDLLWLEEPLAVLRPLAHGAAALLVLQVLAAVEADPAFLGNTRLVDVESGEVLEVFVDAVTQARYRQALATQQQNWHRACRQVGAYFATVIAEPLVQTWAVTPLQVAQILEPA